MSSRLSSLKEQAQKIQARWRKVVTGQSDKRIRDHLREAQEKPRNVKLFDKIAFTLGVLNIVACQYFLLNIPEYFPKWYLVVVPLIVGSRVYHFRCLNFHYFLIDFCYFTIFCSFLHMSFFTMSARLFKILFIHSCGVLPVAIAVWRNSFIFHDFDKMASVYIHILPCMLYYSLRWYAERISVGLVSSPYRTCLTFVDFFWATLLYVIWQVGYLIKTEFIDKEKFESHPEIPTSLRWLAQDTKNELSRFVLRSLRNIGIFSKNEDYNPKSLKTKLVFVGCQLILTLASSFTVPLFYNSQRLHLCWIGLIFTVSIFNGASFYIEIFSVRYQKQLKKLEEIENIARDATEIVRQIANYEITVKNQIKNGTNKDTIIDNSEGDFGDNLHVE